MNTFSKEDLVSLATTHHDLEVRRHAAQALYTLGQSDGGREIIAARERAYAPELTREPDRPRDRTRRAQRAGDAVMSTPTLLVVTDGHYPSVRELHGLDFKVSVVMAANDMTWQEGLAREEQLQRLALAWNSHDALAAALDEALEYFEDREDVIDGDEGQPAPNKEMRLAQSIRAALKAAKGQP